MRRLIALATVFAVALVLVLPFVGGGGPSFLVPATATAASGSGTGMSPAAALVSTASPVLVGGDALAALAAQPDAGTAARDDAGSAAADSADYSDQVAAALAGATAGLAKTGTAAAGIPATDALMRVASTVRFAADREHLALKPAPKPKPKPVQVAAGVGGSAAAAPVSGGAAAPVSGGAAAAPAAPACPGAIGGAPGGAPGATSAGGVPGTTSGDLASFAAAYNAIRVANCLAPIAPGSIRYDSCMEQRLFWMAEDPSTDPMSAWGHMGSVRSDGKPSVGCDGNLAGGSGDSGASVAQKWWDSAGHRASLYRPGVSTAGACIYFAMSHGGVPNEPYSFVRAAARWGGC